LVFLWQGACRLNAQPPLTLAIAVQSVVDHVVCRRWIVKTQNYRPTRHQSYSHADSLNSADLGQRAIEPVGQANAPVRDAARQIN
jgi:hypothetical protein